jgi:hypothetical protein
MRFNVFAAASCFMVAAAAFAQSPATPPATPPAPTAATVPCPSAPVTDHGKPAAPGQALASPAAEASVTLGGKTLTVHYNAPSMRCRTIMGEVVPYDKVWRTGANAATSFTTQGDVTVGGLMVPEGSYTLYTLPATPGSPWLLIVNKQTGQWGTVYTPAMDLGRAEMRVVQLSKPQEVMSISFENTRKTSTQLHIRWEKTDVYVPIHSEY